MLSLHQSSVVLQLPGPHKLLRGAGGQQQQQQLAAAGGGGSNTSPHGSHHHRKAKGAKQKAILQARAFKVRLVLGLCGSTVCRYVVSNAAAAAAAAGSHPASKGLQSEAGARAV
jgi:hypothetical protein